MNQADKEAFKAACNEWHLNSGGKDLGEFMFNAALAHARSGEAVAWMAHYTDKNGNPAVYTTSIHELAVETDANGQPDKLFTQSQPAEQPREVVRLTDEELNEVWKTAHHNISDSDDEEEWEPEPESKPERTKLTAREKVALEFLKLTAQGHLTDEKGGKFILNSVELIKFSLQAGKDFLDLSDAMFKASGLRDE